MFSATRSRETRSVVRDCDGLARRPAAARDLVAHLPEQRGGGEAGTDVREDGGPAGGREVEDEEVPRAVLGLQVLAGPEGAEPAAGHDPDPRAEQLRLLHWWRNWRHEAMMRPFLDRIRSEVAVTELNQEMVEFDRQFEIAWDDRSTDSQEEL